MTSAATNRYRFFRKDGKTRIEGVSPLSEGAVCTYEALWDREQASEELVGHASTGHTRMGVCYRSSSSGDEAYRVFRQLEEVSGSQAEPL